MSAALPDSGADATRILIVDDDERNLIALSNVLQDIAEVVTAGSGRDALRLLLNHDFAVILLDVYMPEMDGYEVANLIRERQQTARIPLIFLSAVNKEMEHLMRGYAMGAVDYVFKPVEPVVLRSKVGVFVDLHRMRSQIAAQSRAEKELRDATHRAELEKLEIRRELDESRMRQAVIVNSLPIMLYMESESPSGRCPVFVGGNVESVTGYSLAELCENTALWAARLHPDDRDRALSAFAEGAQLGAVTTEYRWQCANGEHKHFLDQAVLLPATDDGPGHFVGTMIDVSERKQLEAQLLQSGKLDAIGRLTGGVAHDFNNLLAAVLGGINILQRRAQLGEREQTVLEQMRHAAEHGAALVKRMMAFARKQNLQPSNVSSGDLRISVLGLVEHTLGGTVRIQWDNGDTACNIFADAAELELALVNVIINARDAMPSGGTISVAVEDISAEDALHEGLKESEYVRITVQDEGTGIAPELIERIVEPFFTTKEVGKGTGLGLSMVSGFAQQSGGKLLIRSERGKGTAVVLLMPASQRRETAKLPQAVASAPLSRRTVLLVDDDDSVRKILTAQLEDMGLEVFAVPSGLAALQHLKDHGDAVDALITDFAMPGITGTETIKRARAEAPGLLTILMTGYADLSHVPTSDEFPVLQKPIDMAELQRILAHRGERSMNPDILLRPC